MKSISVLNFSNLPRNFIFFIITFTFFQIFPLQSKSFPISDIDQDANIMTTGVFHSDEVSNLAVHKKWLGLCKNKDHYQLQSVAPVFSKNVNSMPGLDNSENGWSVSVNQSECLVLISNLKLPTTPTINLPLNSNILMPGENLKLKMGENSYLLSAKGKIQKSISNTDILIKNYKLKLSLGNKSQMISSQEYLDGKMIAILWAGDMDGDGKLDLVINNSSHYNKSFIGVYLSTVAVDGELIHYIGGHYTIGC